MYNSLESGTYKFMSAGLLKPVEIEVDKNLITIRFRYDKLIVSEVKSMQGARWNPDHKLWRVTNNQRNRFHIRALASGYKGAVFTDPYAYYDRPPVSLDKKPRFNVTLNKEVMPYEHQWDMAKHILTYHYGILAAEMGTGKTLAMILAMEASGVYDWWYVGPKAAIKSVERELRIWKCYIQPVMMTYEELTKRMKNWDGRKAPQGVVYDECSRIKTHTAQRSQAAKALADGIRDDWEQEGFVIGMSGSPAPKSPADWWHQCEVAMPGFLKEGDIFKFRNRLGIIVQRENVITGGVYPHLICWKDDASKCLKCGKQQSDPIHMPSGEMFGAVETHPYEKSENEVATLYKRMKGLVIVKFKKDCLELPDKQYRLIEIKPTKSILRAAEVISKSSPTTIQGITLLRELSDGFQYVDTESGDRQCGVCSGSGKITEKEEVAGSCPNCSGKSSDSMPSDNPYTGGTEFVDCPSHQPDYIDAEHSCPNCGGKGVVMSYERSTKEVVSAKETVLKEILEEHEESGRLVVFAGFQGSIDKCVRVCHSEGWHTIRVDGRGWHVTSPDNTPITVDPLSLFQDLQEKYPKVAFVGHPASGGMGLTLTASRSILYYSNDFNAESRIQSEDRIHRPGMDVNKGATIIDIIHLPTDKLILNNLKAKRDLQAMSLGDFSKVLAEEGERVH